MRQVLHDVPVTINGETIGMADIVMDDIVLEYKSTKKSIEKGNEKEKVQFT